MQGQRAGAVHWAVPAGAEFDADPERDYDGREVSTGWNANYDPWGRLEEASHWRMANETEYRAELTEVEADFDPAAYFGEDDPEVGMPAPRRHPLRVHVGVFDDLADPLAYVSPAMVVEAFEDLGKPLPRQPRRRQPGGGLTPKPKRPPYAMPDVRKWAREQGFNVRSHGRIPNEVWTAWRAQVEEADRLTQEERTRRAARHRVARERNEAKAKARAEAIARANARKTDEELREIARLEARERQLLEVRAKIESTTDYGRAMTEMWGES